MISFPDIGSALGELVESKQAQYGDSVGKTGAILRALYPSGIFPDQFEDLLLIVRILDKVARLANRREGTTDNESPYRDIAGYGLLGMRADDKKG